MANDYYNPKGTLNYQAPIYRGPGLMDTIRGTDSLRNRQIYATTVRPKEIIERESAYNRPNKWFKGKRFIVTGASGCVGS